MGDRLEPGPASAGGLICPTEVFGLSVRASDRFGLRATLRQCSAQILSATFWGILNEPDGRSQPFAAGCRGPCFTLRDRYIGGGRPFAAGASQSCREVGS